MLIDILRKNSISSNKYMIIKKYGIDIVKIQLNSKIEIGLSLDLEIFLGLKTFNVLRML